MIHYHIRINPMHGKDNIYLSPIHRLHSVSESQQYSVMRDFGSCGVLRTSYILSSHTHLIPHTTTDQLPSGKHGPHFDLWQFLMFINTMMACFYCILFAFIAIFNVYQHYDGLLLL